VGAVGNALGQATHSPIAGAAYMVGLSAYAAATSPERRRNRSTIRSVAAGALGVAAGVGVSLITKNTIVTDITGLTGAAFTTGVVNLRRTHGSMRR
jgi:hypothetical protein